MGRNNCTSYVARRGTIQSVVDAVDDVDVSNDRRRWKRFGRYFVRTPSQVQDCEKRDVSDLLPTEYTHLDDTNIIRTPN